MPALEREDARAWAFKALEFTRGSLGMEQGSDLLMQLVYLRWASDTPGSGAVPWSFPFSFDLLTAPGAAQDKLQDELSRRLPYFRRASELPLKSDGGRTLAGAAEFVTATFAQLEGEPLRRACHLAFEELLLVRTEELSRHSGEISTPVGVARLMFDVLDIREGAVLDPACGIGTSLLAAASSGPGLLAGWDLNASAVTYATMRLELAGVQAVLEVRDALRSSWPKQFSAVVLQPPFGLRLSPQQTEELPELPFGEVSPSAADMAWLQLACGSLVPGGRASMLATRATLMRQGREANIRRNLLRAGLVEAVIALPPNLFPHTAIPSAIWLMRSSMGAGSAPEDVLVVNAQGLERPSRRPGQNELPAEAVEQLVHLVRSWRESGVVRDAPGHLARAVAIDATVGRDSLLPQQYLESPPRARPSKPMPPRSLLTQVRLTNFKSFGDGQAVDLAPINLLYGPNSAGKSSLIQSLLLLKQSLGASNLVTEGEHTDAGSFLGALHNHAVDAEMGLGFTFGSLRGWEVAGGTPDPSQMRSVDFHFRADASGLSHQRDVVIAIGDVLRVLCVPDDNAGFQLALADAEKLFSALSEGTFLWPYDTRHAGEEDDERKRRSRLSNARSVARKLAQADMHSLPLGRSGLMTASGVDIEDILLRIQDATGQQANIVRSYAQRAAQVLAAVGVEAKLLLDDLVHLGPLRPPPQRFYSRASANSSMGGRTALHLFDNTSEVDEVSAWLVQLGVPYALAVAAVQTPGRASVVGDLVAMVLTDIRTKIEVSPVDVGFGVSQVLPIVVELLSQQESIICIEQPETHLHPKLQTGLADLFIHSALTPGHENQLLIETHSEHILLRLQRRIREKVINPSDIAILYVSHDDERGASVRRMPLDDEGHFLEPWPAGFFDEELDELFGGLL